MSLLGLEEGRLRAVLRPSGLVAALGFPFPLMLFCSVAELNFGFIFPCHFFPMVAWVPGRGLPRSLTLAQLWRKCPVQTCVRPETALHLSSRVLRASPCASALKSAAGVQLCSVASLLLLPSSQLLTTMSTFWAARGHTQALAF